METSEAGADDAPAVGGAGSRGSTASEIVLVGDHDVALRLAPPTAARVVLLAPEPPLGSLLPPMPGVMARPEAECSRGATWAPL
eukprot:5714449-Alexandrium_andersonii.AAC.1